MGSWVTELSIRCTWTVLRIARRTGSCLTMGACAGFGMHVSVSRSSLGGEVHGVTWTRVSAHPVVHTLCTVFPEGGDVGTGCRLRLRLQWPHEAESTVTVHTAKHVAVPCARRHPHLE